MITSFHSNLSAVIRADGDGKDAERHKKFAADSLTGTKRETSSIMRCVCWSENSVRARDPELALLDLAKAADRNNDPDNAAKLYEQALTRVPTSWRAAESMQSLNGTGHTISPVR